MKINEIKKRYILLAITIIYCIAKIYVSYTPNPNDDNIPDNLRDVALRIFQVNEELVLGYKEDNAISV